MSGDDNKEPIVRFKIACKRGELFETVGDPVELPNAGGEVFVVHFNPLFKNDFSDEYVVAVPASESELFRVTHVETGFRVAGGDTIDEAIERATAKLIDKGAAGWQRALRRAREERRSRDGGAA
jgi:hypothetical protein